LRQPGEIAARPGKQRFFEKKRAKNFWFLWASAAPPAQPQDSFFGFFKKNRLEPDDIPCNRSAIHFMDRLNVIAL
jgi:hypothetical protein